MKTVRKERGGGNRYASSSAACIGNRHVYDAWWDGTEGKVQQAASMCQNTSLLWAGNRMHNNSFRFQFNFYFVSSEFVRQGQPTRLLNFLPLITTVKWGDTIDSEEETLAPNTRPKTYMCNLDLPTLIGMVHKSNWGEKQRKYNIML